MSDRSILSPQNANALNGLFDGSGTIDTGNITAASIELINGNSGGITFDTPGTLTITRNVSDSLNEFDFVAINPTTVNGMNFYVAQNTAVTATTLPKLAISTTGIAVNGTCNATSLGVVNGANSISLTSTTPGTLVVGGTCNASALGITNGVNIISLSCTSPATLSVGGTCNAKSFGITNGAFAVGLECLQTGVLSVGGTLNCSAIGLNGGALTSDGTNLFWNSVQINP